MDVIRSTLNLDTEDVDWLTGAHPREALQKQGPPCPIGQHRHQGMEYCHLIAQRHRFEYRSVGVGGQVPSDGTPDSRGGETTDSRSLQGRLHIRSDEVLDISLGPESQQEIRQLAAVIQGGGEQRTLIADTLNWTTPELWASPVLPAIPSLDPRYIEPVVENLRNTGVDLLSLQRTLRRWSDPAHHRRMTDEADRYLQGEDTPSEGGVLASLIDGATPSPQWLFRGFRVDAKPAELTQRFAVGSRFQLGVTSFAASSEKARAYAMAEGTSKRGIVRAGKPVMFALEGKKKYLRLRLAQDERTEALTSGTFEVTGVEKGPEQTMVVVIRQIHSGGEGRKPRAAVEKAQQDSYGGLSEWCRKVLERDELLQKQGFPCVVGQHRHQGIEGCHLIRQHHRFEHRSAGAGGQSYEEYTAPEPQSEEEDVLTSVTVAAVARAHGIQPDTLYEHMHKLYGRSLKDQMKWESRYSETGRYLPYPATYLTASQVATAHDMAAEIKRRTSHYSSRVVTTKLPSGLITRMLKSFPWLSKQIEPEAISESMQASPDPVTDEFYEWIDDVLSKAGVVIGGEQARGAKTVGKAIETRLYHSLEEALNAYLSKLKGTERKEAVLRDVRALIRQWHAKSRPSVEVAFEKLFTSGFLAGAAAGGKMGLQDVNAMEVLKRGAYRIGERITLFTDEAVQQFGSIITNAYTPEGTFELNDLVRRMREVVPEQRYKLERIVRTETGNVSNIGRLWAWEQDPEKYRYQYFWRSAPDSRRRKMKEIRSAGNPYDYDGIKFLWLHNHQNVPGVGWQLGVVNCRCSLTRSPVDEEFHQPGRFEGQEHLYKLTADVTF